MFCQFYAATLAQFGGDIQKVMAAIHGQTLIAHPDPRQHPFMNQMPRMGGGSGGHGGDDTHDDTENTGVDGVPVQATHMPSSLSKRQRKRPLRDQSYIVQDEGDEDVDVEVTETTTHSRGRPRSNKANNANAGAMTSGAGSKTKAPAKSKSKKGSPSRGNANDYEKKYISKSKRRSGSLAGDEVPSDVPSPSLHMPGPQLNVGLYLPDHISSMYPSIGHDGRTMEELGIGSPSGVHNPFDGDFLSPSAMNMMTPLSPSFTQPNHPGTSGGGLMSVDGVPGSVRPTRSGRQRRLYDGVGVSGGNNSNNNTAQLQGLGMGLPGVNLGVMVPPAPGSVMSLPGFTDMDYLAMIEKEGGLGSVPMSGVPHAEDGSHFRYQLPGECCACV